MKFEPTVENEIYLALIRRQTTFKIDGIKFTENLITGTDKERERKCRAKAKELAELLKS